MQARPSELFSARAVSFLNLDFCTKFIVRLLGTPQATCYPSSQLAMKSRVYSALGGVKWGYAFAPILGPAGVLPTIAPVTALQPSAAAAAQSSSGHGTSKLGPGGAAKPAAAGRGAARATDWSRFHAIVPLHPAAKAAAAAAAAGFSGRGDVAASGPASFGDTGTTGAAETVSGSIRSAFERPQPYGPDVASAWQGGGPPAAGAGHTAYLPHHNIHACFISVSNSSRNPAMHKCE